MAKEEGLESDVPPLDDTRYNLTKGGINGKKGYTPEQIINKLREAEVTDIYPCQNDEYIRLSTKSIKNRGSIGELLSRYIITSMRERLGRFIKSLVR